MSTPTPMYDASKQSRPETPPEVFYRECSTDELQALKPLIDAILIQSIARLENAYEIGSAVWGAIINDAFRVCTDSSSPVHAGQARGRLRLSLERLLEKKCLGLGDFDRMFLHTKILNTIASVCQSRVDEYYRSLKTPISAAHYQPIKFVIGRDGGFYIYANVQRSCTTDFIREVLEKVAKSSASSDTKRLAIS